MSRFTRPYSSHFSASAVGTGVRGLKIGLAILPQDNQKPLVVKDNVGRPPGELGVTSPWNAIVFPLVPRHCGLGIRLVKPGSWFVDGVDMTASLHVLRPDVTTTLNILRIETCISWCRVEENGR